MGGTVADAFPASAAFVHIHFVEEGIYVPGYVLGTGNHGRHDSGPYPEGLAVGNAVLHLIDENIHQFVIHSQHFPDKGILKLEMDVIRHHEMIFVVNPHPVSAEFSQ